MMILIAICALVYSLFCPESGSHAGMPRHLDELPVGITRSQFYLHANFATLHEEASAVPSRTSIIWLCPYAASAYRFALRACWPKAVSWIVANCVENPVLTAHLPAIETVAADQPYPAIARIAGFEVAVLLHSDSLLALRHRFGCYFISKRQNDLGLLYTCATYRLQRSLSEQKTRRAAWPPSA
jgi:hypothetical protein